MNPSGQNIVSRILHSTSLRAKVGRIALLGILLSFVALALNAAVVGVAMYSASKNFAKCLVIKELNVDGLSSNTASVQVKGKLKSFVSKLFKVHFNEPIEAHLSLPELVSGEVVKLEIPPFAIGGDKLEFDFTGENNLRMSLYEKYEMKDSVKSVLDLISKGVKVQIRVKISGSTNSFWIPVSFEREVTIFQSIKHDASSNIEGGVDLKSVKFADNSDPNNVQATLNLALPQTKIPHYLRVEIPNLVFHCGYTKNDLKKGYVADFKIVGSVLSREENSIQTIIKIDRRYQDDLINLLKDVKEGNKDFSLTLSGAQASRTCREEDQFCPHLTGIQRFLSSIEVSEPYESLSSRIIPGTSDSYSMPLLKLPFAPEIGFLGLVSVSNKFVSAFIFEAGLSKHFVSDFLGFDVKNIEGILPPLSLKNVVEYRDSKENSVIARMEIKHVEPFSPTRESFFHFEISVEVSDSVAASKLLALIVKKGFIRVGENELRDLFKRLYITGNEDNLISSIVSVYELEFPFSDGSEDIKDLNDWTIGGYKMSLPEEHKVASHLLEVNVVDEQHQTILNVNLETQDEAVIENPAIRLYWNDVSFVFESRISQLARMHIPNGYMHVSLAQANPLTLLHKGKFKTSFMIEDSPILLNGWKSFANAFISDLSTDEVAVKTIMGEKEIQLTVPVKALSSIRGTDLPTKISQNTQLRIRGFKDSTVSFLARISPYIPIEPKRFKVAFSTVLPEIYANICMLQGVPDECCDLARIAFDAGVVSGVFADDSLHCLKFLSRTNSKEPSEVSEWLPFSFSIIQLFKLVEAVDKVTSDTEQISLSLGQQSKVGTSLLNRFVACVGSSASFLIPKTAPQVAGTDRHPIENFSTVPAKLMLNVASPTWSKSDSNQTLIADISLKLPTASMSLIDTSNTGAHSITLQWGKTELEFIMDDVTLKIECHEGFAALKTDRGNGLGCSDEFKARITITLPKNYSTFELRTILNSILSYTKGVTSQVPTSSKITVKASVEGRSGAQPYLLDSDIHVETLLKALKVILNRAKSKPPPINSFMETWVASVRMRSHPDRSEATIPCFIPSICHGGLLDMPSHNDIIGIADTEVSQFIQMLGEMVASLVARAIQKIDLPRYPRSLVIETKFEDDFVVNGAVNDIDLITAIIPKEQFALIIDSTLVYPDEYIHNEAIVQHQMQAVKSDIRKFSITLKLAESYHDASGIIKHIKVDPMLSIALDPVPKEIYEMTYSPLTLLATTERLDDSNLFTSLMSVFVGDMNSGYIISQFTGGPMKNDEPKMTGSVMSVKMNDILITNPSHHFDFVVEEGLTGGYCYKRETPKPKDPADGFLVTYGSLFPPEKEKFPIILKHNSVQKVDFEIYFGYEVEGLNYKLLEDSVVPAEFLQKLVRGLPFSVIMKTQIIPGYRFRMPMSFPERPFSIPHLSSSELSTKFKLFIGETIGKIMNLKNVIGQAAASFKHLVTSGEPDIPNTKVYWPKSYSGMVGTQNEFVIAFVDKDGFRIAMAKKSVLVKLMMVDSKNPRIRGSKYSNFKNSIQCVVSPMPHKGFYKVAYSPILSGRYAIFISVDNGKSWKFIEWDFAFVRNLW